MNLALLEDGLIVMIIGMGTVFIFLTIMIWAMDLKTAKKNAQSDNNEEIALAIACAMAAAGKKQAA